jgi:hypothetical protein
MKGNVGKNANMPCNEDLKFIYGLLYQFNNDSLINYIASVVNSIPEHNSRKLKIFDWINSIKWVLERVNLYDSIDLLRGFSVRCFNTCVEEESYTNLNRALYLFESLNNYEDIQTVGDREFHVYEMSEMTDSDYKIIYRDEILEKNKNDFFSYDLDEQKFILILYNSYKETLERLSEEMDDVDLFDYVIDEMARKKLVEPLKTKDNIALIERACEKLLELKESEYKTTISDDEITEFLGKELYIDKNLILSAYFLQYVLMSFDAPVPKNNTPFRVSKVTGKQSKILQLLLCASTTKNWKMFENRNNTYFQTVNKMFSFKTKMEQENVLIHLGKVRKKLESGGFYDAVKLLNDDVDKIKTFKIPITTTSKK